jgi:hypothetical protein
MEKQLQDRRMGMKKEANAKKEILKYIPSKKIEQLLQVYQAIKNDKEVRKSSLTDIPIQDLQKIFQGLENLQKKKWLVDKEVEYLIKRILSSVKIRAMFQSSYHGVNRKISEKNNKLKVSQNRGRPSDDAYSILVFCLVSLMTNSVKGKPSYELIDDFLYEQDIKSSVKMQYRRLKEQDVQKKYEYYYERLIDVKKNPKSKGLLLFNILPTWTELISIS